MPIAQRSKGMVAKVGSLGFVEIAYNPSQNAHSHENNWFYKVDAHNARLECESNPLSQIRLLQGDPFPGGSLHRYIHKHIVFLWALV
jgi:hypothetical protein